MLTLNTRLLPSVLHPVQCKNSQGAEALAKAMDISWELYAIVTKDENTLINTTDYALTGRQKKTLTT